MTHSHDYPDEMRNDLGLSERELQELLTGKAPAGREDLRALAEAFRSVPAAFRRVPDERTEHVHLTAIVSAAARLDGAARPSAVETTPAQPIWRRVVSKTKLMVLRVSAGAGAALLALTGYAYAGGDLPSGAESTLENILNVELPGGSASRLAAEARSDEVLSVIQNWEGERGCEFGQAVAAAASGEERDHDPCVRDDDGSTSEDPGKSATGEEKSAAGKAKAAENKAAAEEKKASAGSSGDEQSSAGKAKAEENKAAAEEKKSSAGSSGDEQSSAGKAKAEENKAAASEKTGAGQDNKPGDDEE